MVTNMCSSVLFTGLIQLSLIVALFAAENQLYEGSKCRLENGRSGICKKLPDCPSRMEEVEKGTRHANSMGRCGFDHFVEIVCCSENLNNNMNRIENRAADVACKQHPNKEPQTVYAAVFNGKLARYGEFPYMVALGYENTDDSEDPSPIKYSCGGSLITSQHVLTAAHCVNNINGKVPIEVRLGSTRLKDNDSSVQRIPISNIISHPQYKLSTHYNDIAILKLQNAVNYSDTAKPVCLLSESFGIPNVTKITQLIVLGWGATSFNTESSDFLLKTPGLSIVNTEECSKYYTGFVKLPRGIDDSLICAIDTTTNDNNNRSDACQGDSGGPLSLVQEHHDIVVGITAFGQSCGSSIPSVYTAVYFFLDWIEKNVWTE